MSGEFKRKKGKGGKKRGERKKKIAPAKKKKENVSKTLKLKETVPFLHAYAHVHTLPLPFQHCMLCYITTTNNN